MLIRKKFKKSFKTNKMETYKKMELKLIDITLPRMEDKHKSLNTHSDKGPLRKLRDS